ncbi:hypothetical protein GALMADRAFT_713990 [Galerina marginata CBS 339.88]|uniref:Uncharacterized protein n=1 Tax=Galerina marginata (strain CBS 339.88) TaxID=685588 RepID=A0A067TQ90_GALM3|nr:hypothetical protein GALMADRAFT_713990 [Galerina marginata CBS 339.88]
MFNSPKLHYSVCLGLHVFLVFIYLALSVTGAQKLEHRITFGVDEGNTVSSRLSSILQAYITVYSATLLFFVQRVSIRQNLLRHEPLTATHDFTTAWSGVGSAVFSLYNQLSVPASSWRVSGVAAYLTCLSIMHITTPTLFTLQLFSSNTSIMVNTTLALPNVFNFWSAYSNEPQTQSEVPFLLRLQSSRPGLNGSTIFDVLQASPGVGTAIVNAITFDVTCGFVQGSLSNYTLLGDDGLYKGRGMVTIPNPPAPNTLYSSGGRLWPHNSQIVLTSTYNFSDSQGVVESVYSMPSTPVMQAVGPDPNALAGALFTPPLSTNYSISSIQIIGCSLPVIYQHAVVDVQSGDLLQILEPKNRTSGWTPFVPDAAQPEDLFRHEWPAFFSQSPQIVNGNGYLCPIRPLGGFGSPRFDYSNCSTLNSSAIDTAIMQNLGLSPWIPAPKPQLTLGMLENAIANTTALIYWFCARYNATGRLPLDLSSRQPNSPYLNLSEVNVYQENLTFRLNLNTFQLVLSTLVTLVLLFLAVILTNSGGTAEASQVDNVGFLQSLWLSHQHPDIKALMAKIQNPSNTELRKQGMTTAVKLGAQASGDSMESTGLILQQFSNDS